MVDFSEILDYDIAEREAILAEHFFSESHYTEAEAEYAILVDIEEASYREPVEAW